ncbi:MAG: CvpA family protein [Ignavibacteria bacterium]|nr:CvpA family protein [Ignavibacteria bacterium]
MNTADISILLGILFFVVLGFRDGFLKKLFTALGFLGGLIIATKFMSDLGAVFSSWLNFSPDSALVMAFFTIFMFAIITVNLFYRWFGQTGSETLKVWSRIAGGLLGGFQGAIAVSLILIMLDVFDVPEDGTKRESMLYEDSVKIAPAIFDYTTDWMPSSKKFFEEVGDKIEKYKNIR